MGKIYKITQEEKENKIRNLDEIFLNDIEKKKSKTYIFSFLIPILSAVLIAGCIFVSVKFGFFVDKGFPWILLLWAISVLVVTAVSISYGKSTKIYKKYEDALIRYEKFCKSPEKFIYKSLDEFDLNDFSASPDEKCQIRLHFSFSTFHFFHCMMIFFEGKRSQ